MTDWKELYQQKLIPVEDIAKVIPPHSHCSLSDGAADPRAITREIEKRYGFIYVDYDNQFNGTGKRSLKDSYYWYKKVTASNGEDLG